MTGSVSYNAGIAAEEQVATKYVKSGFELLANRFRGREGEVDLVARHNSKYYFIEVKKAANHDLAAARIRPDQIERIQATALRYLQRLGLGPDTEMRFDAALVDEQGHIKVIPNAFV